MGPDVDSTVLDSLSEEERRAGVAYVDDRVVAPGETLRLDGEEIRVTSPVVVAFVDREPGANWGHDCRYLLIDPDSRQVRSVAAQFPPFLRGVPDTLRVVYRADGVPDWAVSA